MLAAVVDISVVRRGDKPIAFNVAVDENLPTRLFGDSVRCRQILNNLLSNAFKFTDKGRVTLAVTGTRTTYDSILEVVVTVIDTGKGIREEDMEKLFNDYVQVDVEANRRVEGTGLGLAISRRIARLMDGDMYVKSEFGKGSVFTATYRQGIVNPAPIGRERADNLKNFRTGGQKADARRLKRAYMPYGRVLVVDDVQTNLDVALGLLTPYGLRVSCATSGEGALNRIAVGEEYDVIFMDHMMPELDGIAAVAKIRSLGTAFAENVPIVALTANAIMGNEELFLDSGFQGFISKPIDMDELDDALNRFVRDKQSAKTLLEAERQRAEIAENDGPDEAESLLNGAEIPEIDVAAAVAEYGAGSVYLGILRSYLRHTPELLDRLKSPDAENLGEYAVAVHGLKGSSRGIFAGAISDRAQELEDLAKAGDLEGVLAKNGAFTAAVEGLLGRLDAFITAQSGESRAERPRARGIDGETLRRLAKAAAGYATAEMEAAAAELAASDYEDGADAELVRRLAELAENLEYEEVRRLAESGIDI
jgi:CheY-like chemotaxis protein/HPt (histidine-containing phosphotransfer) domain-containing protein